MSESLALLVFFLHLLFALFLLTLKTGKKLSNGLFAAFLLITAFDISNFIFNDFYRQHLNLDMMRANLAALLAPTLYFYVKSVLVDDFRFRLHDAFHLLPYILVSIIFVPRFHLGTDLEKTAFYNHQQPMTEMLVTPFLMHIQLAVYLVAIFIGLSRYKVAIEHSYSDLSSLNKNWLKNFMLLFLTVFIVATARNVFKYSSLEAFYNFFTPLMMCTTLIFICWIVWQTLHRPEIFSGIKQHTFNQSPVTNSEKKSGITEYEAQQIIQTLEEHMSQNHAYLIANLSIDKLAETLNIDNQHLSWALNHHLNIHFFDYINKLRIEAACTQLKDAANQNKTILEILHAVGFNSKSSFNTAFKKHTGMTPSHYRKANK